MAPKLPASIQSVPEALAFWAERAPESTALLSPGQAPVSYRELHDRAARMAAALRMLGMGRRHAMALAFPDGLEFCVALLAAMTVGTAVPLAWPGTEADHCRVLSRCRVRAVMAAAEAAAAMRLAAGPAVPVVSGDETIAGRPEALFARAGDWPGPDPSFPDGIEEVAVVLKSAGTTGRPKLIPRTHQNIASFCRDFIAARALTPADRGLSLARPASSQGLHTLATTIFAGASLIVVPQFDQRALAGWLRTHRPTYLSATPAILRAIAADSVALREIGLRCVFATSAPLQFEEAEQMESALGAPILNMYGMTEATGIAAERFPRERRVPGSVGPAWCDVRVIEEGGECLGPNETGEILVRGPRVSPGYLDDPELNAASFVEGGWLRTGDLGFVDEAGYLHLRGRSGEMVNRGGEKIDPGEVDAVLLAYPAVADAAAFAVPDALLGEDIVAAVVPASGATVTARQLRSWLLDRLMPTQSPRRIWFVEDIPRTANGKVQRGELARRWESSPGVSGGPQLPEAIKTIPDALAFWAERTPEAPALRSLDGRALSHRELYRATAVIVARLRALGIGPDDRVALVLPPGFDCCVAMMGALSGAVAVPLPIDATDHERARDLERLPPRLVVSGGSETERVRPIAARLGIAVVDVDELCDLSLMGPRASLAVPEIAPEWTAVILHTSGTTGLPKRVPRSHRALLVGSRAASRRTGLVPDDVLLLAAGLHNISGLGNLLNALLSGGCCLAASGLDPVAFGSWLEEECPTWTFLTPTHLRLVLETAAAMGRERVAGERSRLRLVRAGTQPLPPPTRMRAEESLRATILDTYGMTEAHSITASGSGGEERRDGSVGRPLAVSLRILDEGGAEVPTGTVGAIVVRGPTVMDGYLDDPEANAAVFTPDGWFRTGDLGYLNADGFLFIVGRAKAQINRGGEQIAPEEIDLILQEHPAVAEAAAFAVPDVRLGEDVVAAVVLRPGMTATAREMRAFLLDRLAPSRAPRRIWFVERLPRTATGKVQRPVLSAQFMGRTKQ